MLNQIGVLTINVHEIDEAVEFYTNILGFEL
ncbi:VOC family protein [Heyndrickxia oleronia]